MGHSNFEPALRDDNHDGYFSRCRWYGKQFFSCVLAEAVFSSGAGAALGDDLESTHMQLMLDFPFGDCVESIDGIRRVEVPGHVYKASKKPFALLMTKIGAILDQGDSGTRQKLAIMIQNYAIADFKVDLDQTMLPPSPLSRDELALDNDQQIAMYTMKLNEWGQRKNKSIHFEPKHKTVDPPLWEVELRVEGLVFIGRAKEKKRAQHIASKQAYQELKIDM